jgi:hypothetical protein
VQAKPLCLMLRAERLHGISGYFRRRWDLGQEPTVRATEAKLAVGLSVDLVALLVDAAMVPATEQGEVRERRGAAVGPVTDVMALADSDAAARKAAAAVAMV